MLKFINHTLSNGLKLIIIPDTSTPLVQVNVLYKVGARNEHPDRTGFAHLFEHLMFGGSANIPDYDRPLQLAGGENNAFTNNDITNYYISLPPENLDIALWLESDRMNELAFTPKSLETQRQVVIEEFRQRNLNQPYGDAFMNLRDLAYKKHPYSWSTIGKCIEHIKDASMEDVKDFFYKHYAPNNAILSIAGNVDPVKVYERVKHWFGDIPKRNISTAIIPEEPVQTKPRTLTLERDVPLSGLYMAYHMSDRLNPKYYASDLISDILSNGKSSWFEQILIKEKQIFSSVDAYILGSYDPGLFVISGKLHKDKTYEEAEHAINELTSRITNGDFSKTELEKVKNRSIALRQLSLSSVENKAFETAFFEFLGDAGLINEEDKKYMNVSSEDIIFTAKEIFNTNNCSTLYYKSKK
ncbi:MAG: pitrilysin family protein [Bacteroidales bacterium]|nr:pitrilysin family protein [Bacteroidales bacterium]